MTEIELRDFKDKLNEAKDYCVLVSQGDDLGDAGRNVIRCLNNLVDAVELLGDAVQNHYHSKDEDFEDLDEYED
jgi:hypothetical protein